MTPSELKAKQDVAARVTEQQALMADIRVVMATPAGRRVIWWILDQANLFRECFTGNSSTFYNLGMRAIAVRVFRLVMKACPDQFRQAQDENAKWSDDNGNVNGSG